MTTLPQMLDGAPDPLGWLFFAALVGIALVVGIKRRDHR